MKFFVTWGRDEGHWLKGPVNDLQINIVNIGSPYLGRLPKKMLKPLKNGKIQLLYPASPLSKFMYDLEHNLPEQLYQHRLQVFDLLKQLFQKYPGLQVSYKPFPGTEKYDPVREYFTEEIAGGKLKLISERPAQLFGEMDVVLWDSISTGFAEALQAEIPTLVFHSREEYKRAIEKGQKIINDLSEQGLVVYDIEAGLRSFARIIDDPACYMGKAREATAQFQRALAYPISKKEFFSKLKKEFSVRA